MKCLLLETVISSSSKDEEWVVLVLLEEVARKVIREALNVTKGDVVGIMTWQHTIDLSDKLAIECYKVGADALTVLDTDDTYFERHKSLPLESFVVNERWVNDYLTCDIWIQGPEDPDRFATVKEYSPQKTMFLYELEKARFYKSLKKKVRSACITLGYVTPQRAKILGFDFEAWKTMMYDTIGVPKDSMAELGDRVRGVLEKGKEVHVISKNGTDLTFQIGSSPVQVDDGVISDDDLEKGNCITHVPAGEVLAIPVTGSAEGKVIGEPFYRGRSGYRHYHPYATPYTKLLNGLNITFKDGKVRSIKEPESVRAGWIEEMFKAAHGDRDLMGWLSLGINPRAEPGYFIDGMVRGAVTVGVGANKELGGRNDSGFAFGATILDGTVELDGKVILKNGKFTL